MKDKILIGLMSLVWLVLMANIIWQGTDGKWQIEDTEKIAELEVAKYTNQVMVVAVSKDGAHLCLYERESNEPAMSRSVLKQGFENWKLVLETEAIIGKNGLGKTKEGDGKTPVGVFLFVQGFGLLENPGTKIPYVQVKEQHYWVDDSESSYYNKLVSVEEVEPDWSSAEHLIEFDERYQYVLATSYNIECISGRGSAVFLHCASSDAKGTAGCIAVPEVYMREIIKRVEPQCVIIIDEVSNILKY